MSNERGFFMPSGKKMYATELKLEIVQKYLQGNVGLKTLAKEYSVSTGDIQKWRDAYLEHGIAGLNTTHGTYDGDFKVFVVEYMQNTGSSIRKTAAHFNIPSFKTVSQWERIYFEQGKEALYEERRGRATKMGTRKPRKPKKDVNVNEDLLAEVQRLRMENEYLKKLNALVQEREKFEKPTK